MSRNNVDSKQKSTSEVKSIPARRLYRGVLEYARRLENGRQHRRNLMSVFQSEQIGLRQKLRDACEKLMFTYPVEYGKKAEEIIWRKVYYEVIQLVKGNKKFLKPGSHLELLYKEYLSAAIGYYHHLLLKLQAHYQPNIDVDWPLTNSPLSEKSYKQYQNKNQAEEKKSKVPKDEEKDEEKSRDTILKGKSKENKNDEKKSVSEWARDTCYRILMCLGDLGRYQIDHDGSRPFAERFYQLAMLVKPDTGMPFNQLGTLAGHHTWWGLTAAYYYYRCLETEHKFDGADGNLQKLLDRNKKSFYQIPTDALENIINVTEYRKEHTRIFIISFLYLCDLLRPKTYATDVEITGMCKKLIDSLPICLAHSTASQDSSMNTDSKRSILIKEGSKPLSKSQSITQPHHHNHHHYPSGDFSRFHPHVVFKMCTLCVINIHNLQSSRSNRSSAAIAFALAFFSHLLGHVISLLSPAVKKTNFVEETIAQDETLELVKEKGKEKLCESGDGDASHAQMIENIQSKKRKTRLMRRRRHRGSGDSDLSEGEETSGSDVSDSDDQSDSSSRTSSNSELSQEDVDDVIGTDAKDGSKKSNKSQTEEFVDNHAGLELANSLSNGKSAMASLKDISQKMFQPTTRRRILLAPSFFNNIPPATKPKPQVTPTTADKENIEEKDKSSEILNTEKSDIKNEDSDCKKEKDNAVVDSVEESSEKCAIDVENGRDSENAEEIVPDVEQKTTVEPNEVDEMSSATFDIHKMAVFHQLFASLKLLCDWLVANEKVTSACAQNSKALWSRLARLVNLLPHEDRLIEMDEVSSDPMLKRQLDIMKTSITSTKKWRQCARLPEDYILNQSTSSVVFADQKINKMTSLVCDLTDVQQCTIRVSRIRSFCHSLVGVEGLEMKYDEKRKRFEGPVEPTGDDAEHLDIETMEEMRKTRLMKDMAELRLRDEVSALETQLGAPRSRDASLCLYLVPDALALCHDLVHIRKLLISERYFVIIPKTVIDGLDGLKKDLQGARDAIRFLETEFKKGNRFIKAQMTEETTRGVQGERPKLRRNDMQAWRFYRIIECCRYITLEKAKQDNTETSGMIAILTHSTDKATLSQNQINAINAAENFGIQVFSAGQFSKLVKKLPKEAK